MHILVATDGVLDVDKTVELVGRLNQPDDRVTVFTAIPFPRTFLQTYGETTGVTELSQIAHEVGAGLGFASGAKAAERMVSKPRPPADLPVKHTPYFETIVKRNCGPLKSALESAGIAAEQAWSSTENQTAKTILAVIDSRDVDLLVIGSHGQGRFEGPLGSTVTKLVRNAEIPVLIVR